MARLCYAERCSIGRKLGVCSGDPKRRVIEETDFSIRMGHLGKPRQHLRGQHLPRPPLRLELRREKLTELYQIQQIFEDDSMVHRAKFEMPAIMEDLFIQFDLEQIKAGLQPSVGLGPGKKTACEYQSLGIGQQMIAQQMKFECRAQDARLDRKALECSRPEIVSCTPPSDPVYDSQRGWIGLPPVTRPRRIFCEPPSDQIAMPLRAVSGTLCPQVVKI